MHAMNGISDFGALVLCRLPGRSDCFHCRTRTLGDFRFYLHRQIISSSILNIPWLKRYTTGVEGIAGSTKLELIPENLGYSVSLADPL
jgi:hypothetical protein